MDLLLAISAGLGLAAATGFRVFLPLLAMSLGVRFGNIDPSAGQEWIGSPSALVVLSVAAVSEVAAYYVPWVDHALDTIASPGAVVGGTLAVATMLPDVDPAVRWSMAIIAGGGTAGVVQAGTVVTRGLSTATTGGLGNSIVSTTEWVSALLLAIVALVLPILAAILVLLLLAFVARRLMRRRHRARQPAT